jgi:hypothetical protein
MQVVPGKSWFLSRTFWAAILSAVGCVILDRFGFAIPDWFIQSVYYPAIMIALRKVTKTEVSLWG